MAKWIDQTSETTTVQIGPFSCFIYVSLLDEYVFKIETLRHTLDIGGHQKDVLMREAKAESTKQLRKILESALLDLAKLEAEDETNKAT